MSVAYKGVGGLQLPVDTGSQAVRSVVDRNSHSGPSMSPGGRCEWPGTPFMA